MFPIKSRAFRKLQAHAEQLQKDLTDLRLKNKDLEERYRILQSTSAAETLFDKQLAANGLSKQSLARLLFLKSTIHDLNYRSYLTRLPDRTLYIDPDQIPISADEEKQLVQKYESEINTLLQNSK